MSSPEIFMKNSPYQAAKGVSYNLSNTTPELLKFQLQEHARIQAQPPQSHGSTVVESAFNSHLQNLLDDQIVSFEEDTEDFDGFSHMSQDSGSLTTSSDVSSPWKGTSRSNEHDFSDLRVLIENSVFDSSNISTKSILSLAQLKEVKKSISEKKELKAYLEEKCILSNQFCATVLSTELSSSELDPLLWLKVSKQMSDLQSCFIEVSRELDELELRLRNHNLLCLTSGYIEDVRFSDLTKTNSLGIPRKSESKNDVLSQQALETLFSHIASLAVQKNVSLPTYTSISEDDLLQDKISWASACIDALVAPISIPNSAPSDESDTTRVADESLVKDHSFLSSSPYKALKISGSQDKTLSEYKLALNDLKFSQEYFAKEYEYLKENSLKTISDYRKKNTALEQELRRLRNASSSSMQTSSRDSLKSKEQEISRLRKELSNLRIDQMGIKPTKSSTAASPSLLSSLDSGQQEEQGLAPIASPTHSNSMSSAILRKEFKKIVEDIQDQYEIELGEERARRREIEAKWSQRQ